jgi:hypothetical protein
VKAKRSIVDKTITYFEKPGGDENTEKTLALAKRRAEELGIKTIVVASTTGSTAVKAINAFEGYKVVVVSHVTGMREPDTQEFTGDNRRIVEQKGGIMVTASHAFGSIHRALRVTGAPPAPTSAIGDIIAMTYRTFGQGMKVACEIAAMAADAGQVRTDEEIISIGGTGRGADTAVVVQPSYTHRFFNLRVKEIICKPRL